MGHYASELMSDEQHKRREMWFSLLCRLDNISMASLTVGEFDLIRKWQRSEAPGMFSDPKQVAARLEEVNAFCVQKGV